MFADWEASIARQAGVLDGLLRGELGSGPHHLLDCACGIGTQAIGLARAGHRVVGSDLSPVAAAGGAPPAAAPGPGRPVPGAAKRRGPVRPGGVDAVVCADNSIAHLLSDEDTALALGEVRRVLRDDGLLLLTVRDYDDLRRTRPASTPPQVSNGSDARTITFQLWHWHEDGEHYDQEHFQLLPRGEGWEVRVRRAVSRALSRQQLVDAASAAGFTGLHWHTPDATGFYQPVLTGRAAG
ncbi:class I SAM-dependent methyltransferase [Streptomyces sp. NPDC058954]|uniref:class I SAM-dependent methyltransferase n=1 Tax=Streptomyces sp. NPDC058954 TaxID=3346677 RepID=UPI003697B4EB